MQGWIGVDLDGTLAHDGEWGVIGDPIPPILERVKAALTAGIEMRIVTARVAPTSEHAAVAYGEIEAWCQKHLGQVIPITWGKDYGMVELWDDRAVAVEHNTGRVLGGKRVLDEALALVSKVEGYVRTERTDDVR